MQGYLGQGHKLVWSGGVVPVVVPQRDPNVPWVLHQEVEQFPNQTTDIALARDTVGGREDMMVRD